MKRCMSPRLRAFFDLICIDARSRCHETFMNLWVAAGIILLGNKSLKNFSRVRENWMNSWYQSRASVFVVTVHLHLCWIYSYCT